MSTNDELRTAGDHLELLSPREMLVFGAAELGICLGERQLDQFDALTALFLEWNRKINLTRITDPFEIVVKHYLDSLSLLTFVNVNEDAWLIDIGTGAGFPGLPLKIARPGIHLVLLDSVAKKLAFAEAACWELGTTGVEFVHARSEDAARDKAYRERFDLAVCRAVGKLAVLSELCLPFCRVGGQFVAYKGPDVDEEIAEAQRAMQVLGGTLGIVHRFSLPGGDYKRTLVVVEKDRHTPGGYPRKGGVPKRDPLVHRG